MDSWQLAAAANNAGWCDAVCRSHNSHTVVDDVAWTSGTRTPPSLPDAITLVPDPPVAGLLARIDGSAGCSIKDSFASLDLHANGFRILFEAEWIVRPATAVAPTPSAPQWRVVREPEQLTSWERAWRGDNGLGGLFHPDLLVNNAVSFLVAGTHGHVAAGAVVTRSASVVGISNFFTDARDASTCWAGCISLACHLFPGSTLVGYESGDMLDAARAQGFNAVGPLRVWLRER